VTVVRFYIARARFDAFLIADRLNQAGIRAHVFNQHAQSIVGDVPPDVAQPQVWLECDDDRERAQVLLDRIEEEARRGGNLHCAECSETSPANFELCWRCGAALVGTG
jgi:Putative prokaryotic signal transducing protein